MKDTLITTIGKAKKAYRRENLIAIASKKKKEKTRTRPPSKNNRIQSSEDQNNKAFKNAERT